MKKLTTITATILIMFFIMSCDKFNPDKYLGDWDFVTINEHYDSVSGEWVLIKCDTIYYSGTITYEGYKDHLRIQYTESTNFFSSVKIDKDGNIYTLCWKDELCKTGKFENEDQLYFRINWYSPDTLHVFGTKRKGGK